MEDDDSFIQQEGLRPEEDGKEGRGHGALPWLIVALLWLLWSVLCVLLFKDSVASAIEDSGVIPLIEAMANDRVDEAEAMRTVRLSYPLANGESVVVSLEARRWGSDALHDTVEALISAYPYEALAQGAVSLVPRDTRLIGLTNADGMCYVDLSGEVLDGPSIGGYDALDQIRDTLMLDESVERVAFLIEGEALDALDGDGLAAGAVD